MNSKSSTILILLVILFFFFKSMKSKNGKMRWPIQMGKITSPFGNRVHPVTGKTTLHNGVDIAVPEGRAVVSPEKGKILKIWEDTTGGKQLLIEHENGFVTGYAHLSVNDLFKVGDTVSHTDIVARTGNTGQSTGAHLHFTLTKDGEKLNPQEYFV